MHLLNGLYDAKLDRAPVIAITGSPYHDLTDNYTQRDINHSKLFMDVTAYTTRAMGAHYAANPAALACCYVLGHYGVAHLSVPVDVQEEPVPHDHASNRNVKGHASRVPALGQARAPVEEIDRSAALLTAG